MMYCISVCLCIVYLNNILESHVTPYAQCALVIGMQMTTVGFGDITAVTPEEQLCMCVVMLAGGCYHVCVSN
jgi:hypothetical protein